MLGTRRGGGGGGTTAAGDAAARRVAAALCCLALLVGTQGCSHRDRPNVIIVVTDDQRWDTLQYMPHVLDQIAAQGVTFTNAFVTSPVCAPSRASLLTGRYARHHGVLTVGAPDGGATRFVGPDASTLATWFHDAGYRTGIVGKYVNDYVSQCPPETDTCYRPPGWDEWHVFLKQHYYDYVLAENGELTKFGADPSDYSTDVLGAKAVEFIERAAGRPFLLYVAFNSPHQEERGGLPIPAPRHQDQRAGIAPWRPPSYDEEDVSDKPPWVALQPRASRLLRSLLTRGAWGDWVRQRQIEALAAVDEAVAGMLAALDATGQAEDTVVVFTSDNGYLWGEHRYFFGKDVPWEESIRVPLVVRFLRLRREGREDSHLVLNIDVAPTVAELAGVHPSGAIDGTSLVPLLRGDAPPWRDAFVVEMWHQRGSSPPPSYRGIRTRDRLFVPYPSVGEAELYDLATDPYELQNRARDDAYRGEAAELRARLDALVAK